MISKETRKKMSEAAKKRAARGILPDNKGKAPWNKGLTAVTDARVESYSKAQKGQKRQGNYVSNGCWVGEGNPWYGKNRSGKNHPRYQPHRHEREYWDFYRKVVRESEKTYAKYIDEINPQGYPRTLCGVEGGYQLDHIKSIDSGWKNKLTVEELSAKENLRIIPWKENRMKGNK